MLAMGSVILNYKRSWCYQVNLSCKTIYWLI